MAMKLSESELAKLESQVHMANLQFPMKASEEVIIEKVDHAWVSHKQAQ